MPKQTFFNLPDNKRQAIEEVAVREFAENAYEQASLSKIVSECQIAKGSMYQYFEDKLDLYLYIVEMAYAKKKAFVDQAFAIEGDIFAVLEAYYRQSFQFSQEYPLLHQVANNFWDSKSEALDAKLVEGRAARALDFAGFLTDAISQGIVNSDLEPQAVFFVYHSVGKALIDQFDERVNVDFLTDVLNVLKYGLKERRNPNEVET